MDSSTTGCQTERDQLVRKRHLDSSEDLLDLERRRNEDFDDDDDDFDLDTVETDLEEVETKDKNLMEAVEALGKLKNSSIESIPLNNQQTNSTNSSSSSNKSNYHQKLLTTVSNYYQSSKDYSPTFKYGAEYVEKRAIPIVKKFEKKFPKSQNNIPLNYIHHQQQKLQIWNLNTSIESKKNLKVLLRIVKLANEKVNDRIDKLQQMISEKEKKIDDTTSIKKQKSDGLKQVKRDIVITVKKAVTVISKFAGDSLPESARDNVREVLLKFPENLSKALNADMTPNNSVPGSPIPGSPIKNSSNPINDSNESFLKLNEMDPNFANRKILILAKESLDSFANIMKIFDSNIQKIDEWAETAKEKEIERLKNLNGESNNSTNQEDEKVESIKEKGN